jgi:hypothetical protein
MEPAFARYRDALCERVASSSAADAEDAFPGALSETVAARSLLADSLSVSQVARRASPEVRDWLSDFDLARAEPCVVLAVIQLLTIWPEAEPGDLLAELARHPPRASVFMTMKALGAMGQTGRADYLDVLATFVDPENDSRVVAKAIRSAAVISGDADLALTVASDEAFPMDGSLAGELAVALMPASGPALDGTMRALLGARDPFRLEAGLKAAAIGVGMPAALAEVMDATALPDLRAGAARAGVDAIREAMPGTAAHALLDLASNARASADARAAALVAIGDAPIEVAFDIASRGPTPFMAVQLARHAEHVRAGSAILILQTLPAESASREGLVDAIRGSNDEVLIRAGRAAFSDPELWE